MRWEEFQPDNDFIQLKRGLKASTAQAFRTYGALQNLFRLTGIARHRGPLVGAADDLF